MSPDKDGTADPIDVQVGLTVRRIRRQLGLSQEKLGSALGLTFQQIQKYDRGTNRMSASALVKAARALNVRVSDLLPDTDAPSPPEHTRHFASVRGAEELLDAFAAIGSARQRRLILLLVKELSTGHAQVLEDDGE